MYICGGDDVLIRIILGDPGQNINVRGEVVLFHVNVKEARKEGHGDGNDIAEPEVGGWPQEDVVSPDEGRK